MIGFSLIGAYDLSFFCKANRAGGLRPGTRSARWSRLLETPPFPFQSYCPFRPFQTPSVHPWLRFFISSRDSWLKSISFFMISCLLHFLPSLLKNWSPL